MGYNTDFNLQVYDGEERLNSEKWENLVESITDQSLREIKDLLIDIEYGGNYKWYEYSANMNELSLYFPNLTFVLQDVREENGDHWIETWQKGKRLTYLAEFMMGKSLITWMKSNHPNLYSQFVIEFSQGKQREPYDSEDFRIGDPIRPQNSPATTK